MSELKAYLVYTPMDSTAEGMYESDSINLEGKEVYLVNEADKVISEKDTEITELKDKLRNVSELLKVARKWLIESQKLLKRCADNAIKTISHNKYKRCLAMARSCKNRAEMFGCMAYHEKLKFGKTPYYQKCSLHANIQMCHKKKWLELAKKFKEAK